LQILALLCALAVTQPSVAASPDPAVIHANATRAPGSAPYREGYYGTGDARLHYVEAGSGPMIMFYHGFPSFWYSWFDQMEAFKGRYRVVAVDGPGANLSAKPTDLAPYRVDRLARQLDGLVRHLNGRRRFTLVGQDWGAALAFSYADAYPRRLHGVVGIAAPPLPLVLDLIRTDAEQQKRSTYMQVFRTLTRADVEAKGLPAQMFDVGYAGLLQRGHLTAAEGELFRAALADPAAIDGGMNWYRANVPARADIRPQPTLHIKPPALLIWGEDDRTFVNAAVDRFGDHAARPHVVRVAGANHWVMMDSPDAVNAALAAFLDERAKRSR
jgi:pimeloyl-ACP methyl ester carboxylesterase